VCRPRPWSANGSSWQQTARCVRGTSRLAHASPRGRAWQCALQASEATGRLAVYAMRNARGASSRSRRAPSSNACAHTTSRSSFSEGGALVWVSGATGVKYIVCTIKKKLTNKKMSAPAVTLGLLALQGAFREHREAFNRVEGVICREVRLPEDLEGIDGLVIPGGESTTIGKLCVTSGLLEPLKAWTRANRPTWGTCAGLILIANAVEGARARALPCMWRCALTARR